MYLGSVACIQRDRDAKMREMHGDDESKQETNKQTDVGYSY